MGSPDASPFAWIPGPGRRAGHEACRYSAGTPLLAEGRLGLLWYVEEQSRSNDYHRYGNLGARSDEQRNGPV